jgi:hypothetical protein
MISCAAATAFFPLDFKTTDFSAVDITPSMARRSGGALPRDAVDDDECLLFFRGFMDTGMADLLFWDALSLRNQSWLDCIIANMRFT